MSEANVEAVLAAYAAWNRGDLSILETLYAPDISADAGTLWPEGDGIIAGRELIITNFASILAAFDETELVAEEVIDFGDTVIVPTLWRGVLAGSTSVVEQRLVGAYTFHDEEMVKILYRQDLAEIYAVLGRSRTHERRSDADEPAGRST